ncbi:bifunctional diguanylate cyclase/phosphodiesterase [Alkaliphilus hydrothermalis]|uniref:Diguanylate cyclase (GGDEF)-like protein n=1 Tax=Alkaliphilus hydrothermalis TaxID=1482730 RepID=A0ABS2NMH4_9FIRM|nr:bifunctional diguanylate cyclase/phosphodiesterase [Alkaliphilus hydrothermalis]MBM7614150.1 diguanylate cyclase (GGDEF)-like protein [Alkaliphilus hydrothermalis]
MKFYKGLIIILFLFLFTSLGSYFNSAKLDSDSQYPSNHILDTMFSGIRSDLANNVYHTNNINALHITVHEDHFPYYFLNSVGVYDGAYIRVLERIGQMNDLKVYYEDNIVDLGNQQLIEIAIGKEGGLIAGRPPMEIKEDQINKSLLTDILDTLANSKEMEELASAIYMEYDIDYLPPQGHNNKRKLIESFLILMPLSWLIIYKLSKRRSEHIASLDFLTKLPNRRAFDKRKNNYDIDTTTAIYIDLDNLKKVNDTVSHKEGDKLIVNFTEKLKSICPPKHIYRVGGDEFIILYKSNIDGLLAKLKETFFSGEEGEEEIALNSFSFSAGVVEMKLFDLICVEEAVNIADYTMYEAKKSGKGHVIKATKKHVDDYRMTNYIKMHVERTCRTRSFIPFFQPLINSETGQIKGFETLVRMKLNNGYAPNDILINQAKELSLLSMIDLQMFEESMKFARVLLDKGLADKDWIFNSNFSAHTLSHIQLKQLISITDKYNINPAQVVIEITEDDLLEKSIHGFLANYKKYGFKIAIDDFGAAYSSFVRLMEIKPDIMKIDRSLLTHNIEKDQDVRNIYNSIVQLGRELKSTITAEGVENIEQIFLLKSLGVETLQGFHFSKPVPMEEFIEFVEEQQSKTIRTKITFEG